jgi:hypothetical protein
MGASMPRAVGDLKGAWAVPSAGILPSTVSISAWQRCGSQPLTGDSVDDQTPPLWRYATPHARNGSRGSAPPPPGCATRRTTSPHGTPTLPPCAGAGPSARRTMGGVGVVAHARKPKRSKASARHAYATRSRSPLPRRKGSSPLRARPPHAFSALRSAPSRRRTNHAVPHTGAASTVRSGGRGPSRCSARKARTPCATATRPTGQRASRRRSTAA